MMIWRPAHGLEGRYEVSDTGEVRRCRLVDGRMVYTPRKPQKINRGYLVVKISYSPDERQKTRTVHSLVAEAFLGPRIGKAQVNHKDGDKRNNQVDNLEWVSAQENVSHARSIGLFPNRENSYPGHIETMMADMRSHLRDQKGEGNYNSRLTEEDASEIIRRLALGEQGATLSRAFNVSKSLVHAIKKQKAWSYLPRV